MIKKKSVENNQVKITLVKSMIGRKRKHIEIAKQLGLRKINQSKVVSNIPAVNGMLEQIKYVLKIEEV